MYEYYNTSVMQGRSWQNCILKENSHKRSLHGLLQNCEIAQTGTQTPPLTRGGAEGVTRARTRPSQNLCKPPMWCRIEAHIGGNYYSQKESHPRRKRASG